MGHVTTRPWFVLGMAFLVLLLIPAWVGIGAFSVEEGGHAEGGHGMGSMNAKKAFAQETEAFVVANTRPDGCVQPGWGSEAEDAEDHDEASEEQAEDDAGDHDASGQDEHAGEDEHAGAVYLQAYQWGYRPARLCLEAGKPYEFRMMAKDVIHGASFQLGPASKMLRLPPGQEVEEQITFTEPGEYLLYCSFYCGVGHQFMKGRIVVEEPHEEGGDEHDQANGDDHGAEDEHDEGEEDDQSAGDHDEDEHDS